MLPNIANLDKDYFRESELLYLTDAIDACTFAEIEQKKLNMVRSERMEVEFVQADVKRIKRGLFWVKNKYKIARIIEGYEEKIRSAVQHKITNQLRKRKNGAEYLRKLIISEIERGRRCQAMCIIEQIKNHEFNKDRTNSKNPLVRFMARSFGPKSRYPSNNGAYVMAGAAVASAGALAYLNHRKDLGEMAQDALSLFGKDPTGSFKTSLSDQFITAEQIKHASPTASIYDHGGLGNFSKFEPAAGVVISNHLSPQGDIKTETRIETKTETKIDQIVERAVHPELYANLASKAELAQATSSNFGQPALPAINDAVKQPVPEIIPEKNEEGEADGSATSGGTGGATGGANSGTNSSGSASGGTTDTNGSTDGTTDTTGANSSSGSTGGTGGATGSTGGATGSSGSTANNSGSNASGGGTGGSATGGATGGTTGGANSGSTSGSTANNGSTGSNSGTNSGSNTGSTANNGSGSSGSSSGSTANNGSASGSTSGSTASSGSSSGSNSTNSGSNTGSTASSGSSSGSNSGNASGGGSGNANSGSNSTNAVVAGANSGGNASGVVKAPEGGQQVVNLNPGQIAAAAQAAQNQRTSENQSISAAAAIATASAINQISKDLAKEAGQNPNAANIAANAQRVDPNANGQFSQVASQHSANANASSSPNANPNITAQNAATQSSAAQNSSAQSASNSRAESAASASVASNTSAAANTNRETSGTRVEAGNNVASNVVASVDRGSWKEAAAQRDATLKEMGDKPAAQELKTKVESLKEGFAEARKMPEGVERDTKVAELREQAKDVNRQVQELKQNSESAKGQVASNENHQTTKPQDAPKSEQAAQVAKAELKQETTKGESFKESTLKVAENKPADNVVPIRKNAETPAATPEPASKVAVNDPAKPAAGTATNTPAPDAPKEKLTASVDPTNTMKMGPDVPNSRLGELPPLTIPNAAPSLGKGDPGVAIT